MNRNPWKLIPCKKCRVLRTLNPRTDVPDLCVECRWEEDANSKKQPLQQYPKKEIK